MASHQERKEARKSHAVKCLFKALPLPGLRKAHFLLIFGICASLYAGLISMDWILDFVCVALLTVLIPPLLIYVGSDWPQGWLFSHLNHETKPIEQNVQKHGAVETYGMPMHDTKFNKGPSKKKNKYGMSVERYVLKYGAVETYQMENGRTFLMSSKHGINLWLGFINVIINAFQRGQSWGGSFSLQHLRVRGIHYRIQMEPTCSGTYGNMLLDLSKLAELLITHFKDGNQDPIVHVRELYDTMTNPPADLISSSLKQTKFLEYLKNHSALKTRRQMKVFIADLCQAYRAMGQTEKDKFDNAMGNVIIVGDWRMVASADTHLNRVLTYGARGCKIKYNNGAHDLFRFLRNFHEHGGDTDITRQQFFKNIQDLEFIAIQEYSKFIADLIYQLVMELDMAGLLEYGWKTYIE